jgi:ketosteroid isomerase-like protein
MTAAAFVGLYESALATQDWAVVEPLMHPNVSVTFSDGSVHLGKEAVRNAFERNFKTISDEDYRIANVHWVFQSDDTAVYLFEFHWTGTVDGRPAVGGGRGTSVLVRERDDWRLLVEHLGPLRSQQ